jgi:glycosyltransferase involved in cell wall biosynthesis
VWENLVTFQGGICFVAPPLDTVPSPHGNAIYTITQDLAARSPVPSLILSIWPEQGESEVCSISDRILYCHDPIKPIPWEGQLPYRLKKFFFGTGRPELLHYAWKAAKLCKLLGVRKIVIEDVPRFGPVFKNQLSSNTDIFLHQHNSPLSYATFWWRRLEKVFTGLIFVSQKTIDDSEKRHGKLTRAQVVYNGVDLAHYDPNRWIGKANDLKARYAIDQDDLIVLYVGRIVPGKGCLELAQAFLRAKVPHTKLVVIGDLQKPLFGTEAYIDNLKDISECNPGKIILPGAIRQNDIPAWYQAADLIVVPSIQSEGLPKVITEALAMGKPVLTSDRGGSLELVRPGQNGWLLKNPQEIESFSSLLKQILTNPLEIQKYGQNALIHDRPKLSIEQSAQHFFDLIISPTAK